MSVFMNFNDPEDARRPVRKGGDTISKNMIDHLDELKQMKVWICWNFRTHASTRASEKDGRPTKVPIAASGEKTGTDEPHRGTWVTFDEAKAAAAEKHYSGVGFVIPEGECVRIELKKLLLLLLLLHGGIRIRINSGSLKHSKCSSQDNSATNSFCTATVHIFRHKKRTDN